MTNEMYLSLMQRVLKTAGVDQGAVLLQKLQDKKAEVASSSHASDEEPVEREIDKQIRDSINSVKASLKELENQLEEGRYVQTTLNFGEQPEAKQKISLTYEKPPPPKRRVQKAAAKEISQKAVANQNSQKSQNSDKKPEIRGGPWGIDEQNKFMEAVRTHGKDWNKITEFVGTRDRRQIASFSQQFRKKNKGKHDDLIAILEGPPYGPGGAGHIPTKGSKRQPGSKSKSNDEEDEFKV